MNAAIFWEVFFTLSIILYTFYMLLAVLCFLVKTKLQPFFDC